MVDQKKVNNDPDYDEDNIYGEAKVIGGDSKVLKPTVVKQPPPSKSIDNDPGYDEDDIYGKPKVIGSAPT